MSQIPISVDVFLQATRIDWICEGQRNLGKEISVTLRNINRQLPTQ
jgi:hypothetical protein